MVAGESHVQNPDRTATGSTRRSHAVANSPSMGASQSDERPNAAVVDAIARYPTWIQATKMKIGTSPSTYGRGTSRYAAAPYGTPVKTPRNSDANGIATTRPRTAIVPHRPWTRSMHAMTNAVAKTVAAGTAMPVTIWAAPADSCTTTAAAKPTR